jgi:hypothetical protein
MSEIIYPKTGELTIRPNLETRIVEVVYAPKGVIATLTAEEALNLVFEMKVAMERMKR